MEKMAELCRALREKKGYTYKKIANDLKIKPFMLKTYVYKRIEPKDPKVVKRVKRYFERELTDAKKIEEKPFKEEKEGIRKRFRELITDLGKGDATKGMKTIKEEMKFAESSFCNWYYQGYIPKPIRLQELADYFTQKLKRKITPEYLLEKEEAKPEEKAKIEEKPKPVTKKKGKPKSEKPVAKPEEKPVKPTIEPEGLAQLIKRCEALTSALREYTEKEKALVFSDEEKKLIEKFRNLPDEAKKGLMLFLK